MAPVRTRFTPLDASNAEAREIAALFGSHAREEAHASVFDGARASKAALIANAGRARYLHVATHGFFAPEDVAVLGDDAGPTSFSEEVSGLSPRVLCGLAFAGANLPQDLVDRARGTLTAEELAYLDLDGCELAVLSACDTSAGLRRAGTGIASLQSALHAAGARTTLTSLWPVPDQATRELMLAFYRGLWSDGLPAAQALWRAKKTLRDRRAPARDWAGWVLTGG
jgi:CHAT domain-containing protein